MHRYTVNPVTICIKFVITGFPDKIGGYDDAAGQTDSQTCYIQRIIAFEPLQVSYQG
jgi:hypothetical protein